MTLLALDLATTTGYAITPLESGTWDLAPRRGDSPGMRFILLQQKLNVVKAAHPDLKLIVYEAPHHRGGHPTEVLLGLVSHVQSWCAQNCVEHTAVHTMTLKKHAGSGKFTKPEMVAAARARWANITIRDDNHADALWLLDYAKVNLQ